MITTITPVVYGGRRWKWLVGAGLFCFGSAITAGGLGWLAGTLGQVLGSWLGFPTLWIAVGVLALAYALHEAWVLRLPYAQRRWQVPGGWRVVLHPWLCAWVYGLLLGPGILTYIEVATVYVVWGCGLAVADPWLGWLVGCSFGVSQGVPLIYWGWNVESADEAHEAALRSLGVRWHVHVVNGTILAAGGTILLWVAR